MSTVVLCGSLGATSAMWDPQLPVLAGRTRRARRAPRPRRRAAHDARRASAISCGGCSTPSTATFSFVGLSLGGAVGMRLARDAPERVERLVLACTSPRFGEPEQWHERAALVRAEGLAAIVDAVLGALVHAGVRTTSRTTASCSCRSTRRATPAAARRSPRWDGRDELARIEAPTLVVAGAEDPTAPPEDAERSRARIPDARVEVIDGAAHLANVERADDFNRLLEEHLHEQRRRACACGARCSATSTSTAAITRRRPSFTPTSRT